MGRQSEASNFTFYVMSEGELMGFKECPEDAFDDQADKVYRLVSCYDVMLMHAERGKRLDEVLRQFPSLKPEDHEGNATAILARLAHANLLIERYKPGSKDEVIQWIDAGKEEPDDEIAVLMVIEECERPFFGYKIGDQWFHDCGDVVAGIVVYWADLPAVPE